MSEKEEKDTTMIKVRINAKEALKTKSEQKGLAMMDIVDYLVKIMNDYDLFNSSWLENLKKDVAKELDATRGDDKLEKALASQTHQAILRAKGKAWDEYLKTLFGDEKRKFLEGMLRIDVNTKDVDFFEKMGKYNLIIINGIKEFVQVNDSGDPLIKTDRKLIVCEKGFHTVGSYL